MKRKFPLLFLIALPLMASCRSEHGDVHEEPAAAHHAGEVHMDSAEARAVGVVVAVCEAAPFRGVVRTSGRLSGAVGDEHTVVALAAGIVRLDHALAEGASVGAGQRVATIATDQLQDGDAVEKARVAYEAARTEYERGQALAAEGIITQSQLTALRADFATARIAYEGVAHNRSAAGVEVKAAGGGFVKALLVADGDYVAAGQPLLTLARQQRLYLQADVPERYYELLPRIRSAHFQTAGGSRVYSLDDLGGRLVAHGRSADAAAPYVTVTFELNNRGNLMPGAFAEVYLLTDERPGVISLPRTALVEEQGQYSVYVQRDGHFFEKRAVRLGDDDGRRVEICSGLREGERVAVEGAMRIKLASASAAIPGHTHNH